MTVKGRFSLDTTILVYAIDRDADERHHRAKDLIGRAARRDCVLTVQALAEFFPRNDTHEAAQRLPTQAPFVHDWLEVFPVISADDTALIDGYGKAVKKSIGCPSGTPCCGPQRARTGAPPSSAKTCRTADA